jgi:hypothetical protein
MIVSHHPLRPISFTPALKEVILFNSNFDHSSNVSVEFTGYKLITKDFSQTLRETVYIERFGFIQGHLFYPFKHRYRTEDTIITSVLFRSGLSKLFGSMATSSLISFYQVHYPFDQDDKGISEKILFSECLQCTHLGIYPDILKTSHVELLETTKDLSPKQLGTFFKDTYWASDIPVADILSLPAMKNLSYEINLKNVRNMVHLDPLISLKTTHRDTYPSVENVDILEDDYRFFIETINMSEYESFDFTVRWSKEDGYHHFKIDHFLNPYNCVVTKDPQIANILMQTFPIKTYTYLTDALEVRVIRTRWDDVYIYITGLPFQDDIDSYHINLTGISLHSYGYRV